MKKLNQDDLSTLKEQLNYYNFSEPNYAKYVLQLRHDSEYIDTFINNIKGSRTSKDDVPLIVEYIDYLEKLIKICQYLIQYINRTRWSYKEMTKKYAINLAVEQETRLFDNYTSLVSELISIINRE